MTDDKDDPNADYTNPDGSVRATRYRYETCVICAGIAGHCEHTRAPSPQDKPKKMLFWIEEGTGVAPKQFWKEIGDMCDSCEKAVQACQCGA
jgi:hypothetical protein